MKRNAVLFLLITGMCFALIWYEQVKFTDGKLHVVFCDVGQGDAIFLRTPDGTDILVDGGPDDRVLSCLSRHMPFWDRTLELTFLTHPHADHLTGLIEVFKRYGISSFNTEDVSHTTRVFKELTRIISEKKIPHRFVVESDKFKTSDGVVIETLWPSKEYVESAKGKDGNENLDKNSYSLVQLVQYKNTSVLLTGDIQAEILNTVLHNLGQNLSILKLPHHGSSTGINGFSFQHVKPQIAVISVGKNNRYHHPSELVLSILQKNRIPFKRIDQDGEVELVVSENGFILKR